MLTDIYISKFKEFVYSDKDSYSDGKLNPSTDTLVYYGIKNDQYVKVIYKHTSEQWKVDIEDIEEIKISETTYLNETKEKKPIETVEFKKILNSIKKISESLKQIENKIKCPKCRSVMKIRKGNNEEFWGCENFSKTNCKGTRKLSPEYTNFRKELKKCSENIFKIKELMGIV